MIVLNHNNTHIHNNNTIKKLVFLVIIGLIAFIQPSNAQRIWVNSEKKECVSLVPQLCLQVKYKSSTEWQNFYGPIEGFNFEPGNEYLIKIKTIDVKNPPADGSTKRYVLKRIIKKTKKNIDIPIIQNITWKLIEINQKVLPNSKANLSFIDNGIKGSLGCNTYFGSYTITNQTINFKAIGSTLMACSDTDIMQLENEFAKLLSDNSYTYLIEDSFLKLSKDNKVVMVFEANK
ncbi:DUF4377 domain-containing protein [Pedobacter flavus]|uniref:DUF4377 domain-containing protein n=1 Tax=Pedobacter flavus TaxID=3113906 RepID=A0ABU7H2D9_9SPHI|nr:DUF4377 domain-containing protein [Pedobacter sp. VNH31]MEE1885484.1 DUF4377 domain-containing protein [Pedobacter sp. VNH31]